MTSIGQYRSLTWGHLRSRSYVCSYRSCCISADAPWRNKPSGTNPVSVSLSYQKLLPKTTLVTSDDLSRGHIALYFRLFVNNFWLNRDTDMGMAPNVCLAKAHRLICNMTYLNHHVTLTWDDLRSNFEIDLSRSSSICFETARRENHIDVKIIALSLLLQNLFTKNYFHINRFLTFDDLFNLEYWLKLKTYRETLVARQMSFQMLFAILF